MSTIVAPAAGLGLEEMGSRLEGWLARLMPAADGLKVVRVAPTGGLSHVILNLDVTWREDGLPVHRGVIVRLDPVGYRKRRGSNLGREYAVLSVLGARGDVPVPKVLGFEADDALLGASFYAMERVQGRTVIDEPPYQKQGWLHDLPAGDRRQVWRSAVTTLARIHAAPAKAFGVLRREADSRSDFDQHVAYWRGNYDWAMDGDRHPIADAAWDWLAANPPANRPLGLAWGDARYVNFMFDGLSCNAVLDWEDVSLSSPLFDLGRWFVTQRLHDIWGLPRLEGLGDRAETLALWEACSGLSAADLKWYEVFSAAGAAGIAARTMKLRNAAPGGRTGPAGFNVGALDTIVEDVLAGR